MLKSACNQELARETSKFRVGILARIVRSLREGTPEGRKKKIEMNIAREHCEHATVRSLPEQLHDCRACSYRSCLADAKARLLLD